MSDKIALWDSKKIFERTFWTPAPGKFLQQTPNGSQTNKQNEADFKPKRPKKQVPQRRYRSSKQKQNFKKL